MAKEDLSVGTNSGGSSSGGFPGSRPVRRGKQHRPPDSSARESSVLEAYGKLPLLFIENHGQVDEAVRYYVKLSEQTVYVTEQNMVFDPIRSDGGRQMMQPT